MSRVKKYPRRQPLFLAALILLVTLVVLLNLFPGREVSKPNVLLITIDSLRYDHLGCFGYSRAVTPNIDDLARESARFTQAISQSSVTQISVPSLITGKYPLFTGVRKLCHRLTDSNETLAEALAGQGYATWAIVEKWGSDFCQGFQTVNERAGTTRERTSDCLLALEELKDESFFIWLYYWDPHASYTPPAHFLRKFEPDLPPPSPEDKPRHGGKGKPRSRDERGQLRGGIWTLTRINFTGDLEVTEQDRQHLLNLYDAEIAYVDSALGVVLDKLRQMGLWEKTLIILSADHGEAFGEHGKYYHGINLYDELVRVPLLVKPPGPFRPGLEIGNQVRNVDIMPTILEFCGTAASEQISGTSLVPLIQNRSLPELPAYMSIDFGGGPQVGFRHQGKKIIYHLKTGQVEMYDLHRDPEETVNLASAPAKDINSEIQSSPEWEMRQALLNHLGFKHLDDLSTMPTTPEIDQAAKERLRALGYIQ